MDPAHCADKVVRGCLGGEHGPDVDSQQDSLLQAEDRRLAALSAELEATSKELNAGRRRLKADLDVALETSKANDATRSELAAREHELDAHEARLKDWRESTKADVAKQVSDQERKLQVCSLVVFCDNACSSTLLYSTKLLLATSFCSTSG